jgi:hypothetical protein
MQEAQHIAQAFCKTDKTSRHGVVPTETSSDASGVHLLTVYTLVRIVQAQAVDVCCSD